MKCNVNKKRATFNQLEYNAMMEEIDKQTASKIRQMERDIDILVAYRLVAQCGFGEKRLKDFFVGLNSDLEKLANWYEMGSGDELFLAERELKKDKIDIDKILKEVNHDISMDKEKTES